MSRRGDQGAAKRSRVACDACPSTQQHSLCSIKSTCYTAPRKLAWGIKLLRLQIGWAVAIVYSDTGRCNPCLKQELRQAQITCKLDNIRAL
jgi:hypothetical protein